MRASCALGVLSAIAVSVAAHAAVTNIQMVHATDYQQTAPNAYQGLGSTVFFVLIAQNTAEIVEIEVTTPPDDYVTLNSFGGPVWSNFSGPYSSQADLLDTFPSGSYSFNWSGGTLGAQSATLNQNFPSGLWPNSFPRFSAATYTGLQNMDATQPFTIALVSSFFPVPASEQTTGGFYISTVQPSGLPGAIIYSAQNSGASATLTSRVLPANTLQPGTSYFVTWIYTQADLSTPTPAQSGTVEFRYTTRLRFTTAAPTIACDDIDFNNNDVFPEDADVIDFFNVLAGADCPQCNDIDFNNNGVFPEDQDVIDFFNVLAGGACP
ncbi:MAG TPA: hypothetical protein VK157_00375 [Phycisphaerales bacterium]|nr:hypothetical protein [Phycisphaerales bacterium]